MKNPYLPKQTKSFSSRNYQSNQRASQVEIIKATKELLKSKLSKQSKGLSYFENTKWELNTISISKLNVITYTPIETATSVFLAMI
uniref:Uncharacterized protein n=1 Tax=Arundo donax TaxID=35708 RepID=A0A0A9HK66_ARUDO